MKNIKNCNNYKTLGTYNSNINSNIKSNTIKENFGAFSISAAVRYPWRERQSDQPPCSGFDQSLQSCDTGDIVGI